MSGTLLRPDFKADIADLRRRLDILERRLTPRPTADPNSHNHDGTGTNAVRVTRSDDTTAEAGGEEAVAVGYGTVANHDFATVIGGQAVVIGADATAVGWGSNAGGDNAVAVGDNATVSADNGTALGQDSQAGGGSTAVGHTARATGGSGTAVGDNADADGGGVAVGVNAHTVANFATAVGRDAVANAGGVAVGYQAVVNVGHTGSIAIGPGAETTAASQTNLGTNNLIAGAESSAPDDSHLIENQFAVWVDETANLLSFKVKYSTGAVKTGTVALT